VAICQNFNTTPDDLYYKWEAQTFNTTSLGSSLKQVDMDALAAIKNQIARDLKKNQVAAVGLASKKNAAMINRNAFASHLQKKTVSIAPEKHVGVVKTEYSPASIPGPSSYSSVNFQGPTNDLATKNQSSCE
jgi:DNA polymerase alpha subunit B